MRCLNTEKMEKRSTEEIKLNKQNLLSKLKNLSNIDKYNNIVEKDIS